jgi:hypothetical protein
MTSFRRNRHLGTMCFGFGLIVASGFGLMHMQEEREQGVENVEADSEEVEEPAWTEMALAIIGKHLSGKAAAEKPAKVVIIFIQRPEAVEELRKVVEPDSLLFSDVEAIAMVNGRIVATDRDAASNALNELGWIDLPMEMWDRSALGQRFSDARGSSSGSAGAQVGVGSLSEEDAARYTELSNKAQLSLIESRQLLLFMEQRGDF